MKQNAYDDPTFFDGYSSLPRSRGGLEQAGEWPAFRALLPPLAGRRVLDLGCGFGWHCRHARQQGAREVTGVDLSENMLEQARRLTDDPAIRYVRAAIEDVDLPEGQFDVAISSLAFHYVAGFDAVCARVAGLLAAGGVFVFSVEHPVITARAEQDWHRDADGRRLHWPLDRYQEEGPRQVRWLGAEVVKYHRTLASHVNALVGAGFIIERLLEPLPPAAMMAAHPEWADETRRPLFLLIRAAKPA